MSPEHRPPGRRARLQTADVRRTKVLGYPAPEYEHHHRREPEDARTAPQAATTSDHHQPDNGQQPPPLDTRSSIWETKRSSQRPELVAAACTRGCRINPRGVSFLVHG